MDVRRAVWMSAWEKLQQRITRADGLLTELLSLCEDGTTAADCTADELRKDVEQSTNRLVESIAGLRKQDLDELMALSKPPEQLASVCRAVCTALNERATKDEDGAWWELFLKLRSSPAELIKRLQDCWVSVHLHGCVTHWWGQVFADLTTVQIEAIRSHLGLQGPEHTAKCSAAGRWMHQWLLVLVHEWEVLGGDAVQPLLISLCELHKLQSAAQVLGQVIYVKASESAWWLQHTQVGVRKELANAQVRAKDDIKGEGSEEWTPRASTPR